MQIDQIVSYTNTERWGPPFLSVSKTGNLFYSRENSKLTNSWTSKQVDPFLISVLLQNWDIQFLLNRDSEYICILYIYF